MSKQNRLGRVKKDTWLSNQKAKLVFRIFIFILPTQLAYHLWPHWAFIFGIRVDYLAPTLYLTDILLFLLLAFGFFSKNLTLNLKKVNFFWILGILIFGLINIKGAASPPASLYKGIKLLEYLLVFFLAANFKNLNFKKDFLKPLAISSALFSLIGIAQFLKGGALGGILYFLGERSFNTLTPGVALVEIFGRDLLRAYSTFPHPNSLAGFFSLVLILCLTQKQRIFKRPLSFLILILISLGIFLSFSLAAWASLLSLGFLYLVLKKLPKLFNKTPELVLFTALLISFIFVVSPQGFSERVDLAKSGAAMFLQRPFFGVGLNNFIINLPRFSQEPQISWLLQPAHNIYILTLSELGVLGFCLLFLMFYRALKKSARKETLGIFLGICFVVLVGSVDHYFVTIQQNLLLLALILGYSQRHD